MKNRSKLLVLTLVFLLSFGTLFAVAFAEEGPSYTVPTLVVEYNDDGTTVTPVRAPFPSKALHFDVYYHGAEVVAATLYFPDGTYVEWAGNGGENADLSDYENGYWHWVYTPSGILTISDSSGDGKIVPYGALTVMKFYDANANGVFDDGEEEIDDWKVHVYNVTDPEDEYFYGCLETTFNIPNIPYGTTFRIVEQMPVSGNWRATTETEYTVTIGPEDDGILVTVEFGNLCLGEGGGNTMGFWGNRNGERVFKTVIGEEEALEALSNDLNLKNADGDDFDPTTYNHFRTWLRNANAVNMQYMLSAQLAAMKLNVMWYDATNGENGVEEGSLVYAPGVCDENDYITIAALMNKANAALECDEASRDYLEALKDALDNANNNENFVQPGPCLPLVFDCCD